MLTRCSFRENGICTLNRKECDGTWCTFTNSELSPELKEKLQNARGSEPPSRMPWHEYFMKMAELVATRSTCDRRAVGAVIVKENTVLSTGYNGAARGLAHCSENNHLIKPGSSHGDHCQNVVHAEINAIAQAARTGTCINKAVMYCTDSPCWHCYKVIINAGIVRVYYRNMYVDDRYGTIPTILEKI